jgi:predicted NUDIX family NTP pyrophosphohydrolase
MEASANAAPINASPVNTNAFDANHSRSGWHGDVQQIQKEVLDSAGWVSPLQTEMARVIVGQRYLVDRLIVGL